MKKIHQSWPLSHHIPRQLITLVVSKWLSTPLGDKSLSVIPWGLTSLLSTKWSNYTKSTYPQLPTLKGQAIQKPYKLDHKEGGPWMKWLTRRRIPVKRRRQSRPLSLGIFLSFIKKNSNNNRMQKSCTWLWWAEAYKIMTTLSWDLSSAAWLTSNGETATNEDLRSSADSLRGGKQDYQP